MNIGAFFKRYDIVHFFYLVSKVVISFLFFLFVINISVLLWVNLSVGLSIKNFQNGIENDMYHLEKEGDEIAELSDLKHYINIKDYEGVLGVITQERDKRNIGLMGVVNKDGIVISRTKSVTKKGANNFLATPQGRTLSRYGRVKSIEVSGVDPTQVILISGRKIFDNGNMIGGLFSDYLADDKYSLRFKDNYLNPDEQVVFYTNNFGIYGSTFKDEKTRSLMLSYFSPATEWIRSGKSHDVFLIQGKFYLGVNIVLKGSEVNNTGAILFVPLNFFHTFSIVSVVLATLILACYFSSCHQKKHKKNIKLTDVPVVIAITALIVFSWFFYINRIEKKYVFSIKDVPYVIYNSILRFQPDSIVFDASFEQNFSVKLDSGGEAINAIKISILYDPNILEVSDVLTNNSFCSFFIENVIDDKKGEVRVSCVAPSPGFNDRTGTVVDIVARAKRPGNIILRFGDETAVLAHDGLGTDVLRAVYNASYIAEDSYLNKSTFGQKEKITAPVLYSPTHPNSERWYNKKDIDIVWKNIPGKSYVYSFDRNPLGKPSIPTDTNGRIKIHAESDGEYYVHIAEVDGKNISPVGNYKIKIDNTPPGNVVVQQSSETIREGEVVRFDFRASDSQSGVSKNYYININGKTLLPVGQFVFVPFPNKGSYKVLFRVFDNAHNYTDVVKSILVD